MKFSHSIAALGSIAAVSAQSLCDKYTTALFMENNATNQETLLILVVNTAVIGNYSAASKYNAVPGILTPGYYNGEYVNLLPYFNGGLASTNNGGQCGSVTNFLDGGGAAPLMMNMPADNTSSNQYTLLTHLYEFFASLLGCSLFGNTVMPYAGDASMYEVHKFMALDAAEFGWFVEQVGLSATSFGVTAADAATVGSALMTLFGYRDSPPEAIPPVPAPTLQAICTDCDCPVSPNPDYSAYGPVIQPVPAAQASSWCGGSSWGESQEWCGESGGSYGGSGGGGGGWWGGWGSNGEWEGWPSKTKKD